MERRYVDEVLDPVRAGFEITGVLADRLVNAGGVELLLFMLDSRINRLEKRWVRNTAFVARHILLPLTSTYNFQ